MTAGHFEQRARDAHRDRMMPERLMAFTCPELLGCERDCEQDAAMEWGLDEIHKDVKEWLRERSDEIHARAAQAYAGLAITKSEVARRAGRSNSLVSILTLPGHGLPSLKAVQDVAGAMGESVFSLATGRAPEDAYEAAFFGEDDR